MKMRERQLEHDQHEAQPDQRVLQAEPAEQHVERRSGWSRRAPSGSPGSPGRARPGRGRRTGRTRTRPGSTRTACRRRSARDTASAVDEWCGRMPLSEVNSAVVVLQAEPVSWCAPTARPLHSSGNRNRMASAAPRDVVARPAGRRETGHVASPGRRRSTPSWMTLKTTSTASSSTEMAAAEPRSRLDERLAVDHHHQRGGAVVRAAAGEDPELVEGQQRPGDHQRSTSAIVGRISGRVTRRNVCQRLAPSMRAAS